MTLLFHGPKREAIDIRQCHRADEERRVDDRLPHHGLHLHVLCVDECLEQVNRGNANQGCRELDLEDAGVDVRLRGVTKVYDNGTLALGPVFQWTDPEVE